MDTKELAVESVKALNCKQIEIVFNQEMNKNSVESAMFYEIYDKGEDEGIIELGENSISLNPDFKTAIITLNNNVTDKLTNSSEAKVVIKRNIKAKSGAKLAEDAVFDKVLVQDGLLPKVTKAEATGEQHIRIIFSEPVYDNNNDNSIDKANLKVVSGTYEYPIQEATLDSNVINLVLGTKMIEGPVTITINNDGEDKSYCIVDYAGYPVFKSSTVFDYVKDTSASVVTVKSATKDKVVLHFSKPVRGTNIKLYHSVKNAEFCETIATETDYTDEITFTYDTKMKAGIPGGNVNFYLVNSDKDEEKLVDGYGIKVPDQTLAFIVEIDETPPVFSSCKYDAAGGFIELTFDEELDIETSVDTNNYEIKNVRYNNLISFSATIHPVYKERVKLILNSKLEDNSEYQVKIIKAQDIYKNKTVVPIVYTLTTRDNYFPEIINNPNIHPHCSAKPQDGKIYIVYSEPMNEAQMLDKFNYMVYYSEKWFDLGDKDKINKVNDRMVEIYINDLDNKNDPTIKPSVKIAPIMDLAGKRLYNSINAYTVESIGGLGPAVVTVKSAKEDKVVLGFSKQVKGSHIKLYYNNESYMAEVTKTDYTSELTFIFNKALPIGRIKLFLENSKITDEKLVDRDGIYVPDQSFTCEVEEIPTPSPTRKPSTDTKTPTRTHPPIDTAAPVIEQIILNKNEGITIEFNEKLDAETATNPDNYVVKIPSDIQDEKIPLSASIDGSGKTVELKFDTLLEDFTEYQLVIKEYKDIYGNKNKSEYIYPFSTLEYTHPEVVMDPENGQFCSTVPEEGFVYIVYSEAMNEEQMLDKKNYQVSIDEGVNFIALGNEDTITKVNACTVQIYFKEFKGTNLAPYVKIAPITDLAGNKLYDSDEHYIVEGIEPEYVCIIGAYLIASNKMLITFNKEMESVEITDITIKLMNQDFVYATECESNTINSFGQTEVVLILNKGLRTDARDDSGESIEIHTAENTFSVSKWGSKLGSNDYYGILNDCVPPEIVMWDHDNDELTPEVAKVIAGGDIADPQKYYNDFKVDEGTTGTIKIYFTEAIRDTEPNDLTLETFNVDGFTVAGIAASEENRTIILDVIANENDTSVLTTVEQKKSIFDSSGNELKPSSTEWEVMLSNPTV